MISMQLPHFSNYVEALTPAGHDHSRTERDTQMVSDFGKEMGSIKDLSSGVSTGNEEADCLKTLIDVRP